jgi:hypothetical protein
MIQAENKIRKFDLEDRLVNYSILIIEVVEMLPNTRAGNHLAGQLIRSGTSPALNYGEAQGAESRSDFIHKMKISLKELRGNSHLPEDYPPKAPHYAARPARSRDERDE